MMCVYQHLVIEKKRFPKNHIERVLFVVLEPTDKALNRMANGNSASQDEPSERSNQMIMVCSFVFQIFSLF